APLLAVSPGQINAVMPWNVLPAGAQTGTAQVVVTSNNVPSAPVAIPVAAVAPGLFRLGPDASGTFWPLAYNNNDASLALPPGTFAPAFVARPAKIGDPATLAIWATGLGPVTVTPADGNPPSGESDTVTKPTILIGGVPAQVVFSGLQGQYPGVYQINVIVQPGTPTGNSVPIQLKMGGTTITDQLNMAVTN
ncbi:MAG TPA: hypothetical protein VKT49_03600, partial [Bryobacteraceae bacterium]|nr:hypothetical protein [Bryobacteraceae bacterium]